MQRTTYFPSLLILLGVCSLDVRAALPLVEVVEWNSFRDHCRQLLHTLEKTHSPLPAETVRRLQTILDSTPDNPAAASAAVQKMLDARCLVGININAESRVKAGRGQGTSKLQMDRPTLVLVKVYNEGGVTHALRVHGSELIRGDKRDPIRWLEAELVTERPFTAELTGRRLEYRVLRLTAHQAGKREATFQFDVGQGTQDLGFRAEVPVLFSIGKAESPR